MTPKAENSLNNKLPYLSETIQYFDSLATELESDPLEILPAMSLEAGFALEPPSIDNFLQENALVAVSRAPIKSFLSRFSREKDEAQASIKDVYEFYKEARQTLEGSRDIVQMVLGEGRPLPRHDARRLVLDYLINGQCLTRLGDTIKLPNEGTNDWSLYTLLGIIRIVNEAVYNQKYESDLPWLADDNSPENERYKRYGLQASNLGDRIGSTIGRAASVTAVSLINPVLKLPDEATIAISYIAGIQARKIAEIQMHRYLEAHPEIM